MKKAKHETIELEQPAASRPLTQRSIEELAAATHRLTMRRVRDLLPGKIQTKRLVLRAPIRGDVPDLVKLADNKAIAANLARLPSPYTRADAVGFIEIFAQRNKRLGEPGRLWFCQTAARGIAGLPASEVGLTPPPQSAITKGPARLRRWQ